MVFRGEIVQEDIRKKWQGGSAGSMQSPVRALCVIAKSTEKSRFMPESDLEQKWKITESINMDVRRPSFFAFCKNSQNSDLWMLSWSEECIKPVPVVWVHSSSLLQRSLMQHDFQHSLSISGSSGWVSHLNEAAYSREACRELVFF